MTTVKNNTTPTTTPILANFCQIKTKAGETLHIFNLQRGKIIPLGDYNLNSMEELAFSIEEETGEKQFTLQLIYEGGYKSHLLYNAGELSPEFPGWSPEDLMEWEEMFLTPTEEEEKVEE